MAEHARANAPAIELMIALRWADQVMGATFFPATERAFSVGASENADFRITGGDLNAIEFYVERKGEYLLLLPGYRGRQLRLNGVAVIGPVPLPERFQVEFDQWVLLGRVYARASDILRESPRSELRLVSPVELPMGCFLEPPAVETVTCALGSTLGETVMTVRVEPPARQMGPSEPTTTHVRIPSAEGYVPTAIVPSKTVAIAFAEAGDSFRNAVFVPAPSITKEAKASSTSREASPGPSGTVVVSCPSVELTRTLSNGGVQPKPLPAAPSGASAAAMKRRRNEILASDEVPVAAAQVTASAKVEPTIGSGSVDHSRRETDPEKAKLPGAVANRLPWQAATTEYTAVELPIVQVNVKSSSSAASRASGLARLGIWARSRPAGVMALALLSGGVMALVAALMVRAPSPVDRKAKQTIVVSTNQVVLSKGTPSIPLASATLIAEGTQAVSPTAENLGQEPIVSLQPIELNAIEHLAAGRHSDALRAYEKLLEQFPDNEVVRATVRILAARLSKDCEPTAGEKNHENHCPELLP